VANDKPRNNPRHGQRIVNKGEPQYPKSVTVKLSWQHLQQSMCHGKKGEKLPKFGVWDNVLKW